MHLELEADGEFVGEDPFDDLLGIDFGEYGGEKDFTNFFPEIVFLHHLAGPFVIGAGGEDKFHLIFFLQEGDVFETVFGNHAAVGAFEIHDGEDSGVDGADVLRSVGFEEDAIALIGEGGHEGEDVWLEEGFASGDFDHRGFEPLHFGKNGGEAHFVAFIKGVFGVAPDATKVAIGQSHKGTRQPGVGAFTLYAFVDFVDC